ncbi:MAG TPA: aminotransferase class V-fold PLP-dependent enzyme [Streptosporangiaceae bacterium]|jgi:isopenicillin-N epimerase
MPVPVVPADLRGGFLLAPGIAHLNHGGFGACPRPVFLAYQQAQRDIEAHPSAFLSRDYDQLMAEVRDRLASYAGCPPASLVLVPNATSGLNAVARSVPLRAGDQVLATDHEYPAADLLWAQVCGQAGASYIRHPIPLPADLAAGSPRPGSDVADSLFSAVTPATRVIFISHITSVTAFLMPVAEICRRARAQGIMTIVDGAHAPGHIPLSLDALGADAYAASAHKWLCAPRGTGFLHVRPEYQAAVLAPLVSHGSGAGSTFTGRFRWQGTRDPGAFLALPAAIDFQRSHHSPAVRRRCHELARTARTAVSELFGLAPCTPDSPGWFRQMVSARVPACDDARVRARLLAEHGVDVPVRSWNGQALVRVSAQSYNTEDDIERLIAALARVVPQEPPTEP